jgi:tellurite resistance protein
MTKHVSEALVYIHNLIAIANADGGICDKELKFLFSKADEYKINRESLRKIIEVANDITFVNPRNHEEKILHLNDCVDMAMADGHFHAEEYEFCSKVCVMLSLSVESLNQVLALRGIDFKMIA